MERYLEFIQNHPLLFGTFIGCLIAYFLLETRRGGKKISPQQLGLMVNNDNAKVIDLRDSKDFDSGHISASENIPFSKLDEAIERLKALSEPVIFVCKMGTHASTAVHKLGADKSAYRLEGGIMNWSSAGLPLVKSNTKKIPKKKRK